MSFLGLEVKPAGQGIGLATDASGQPMPPRPTPRPPVSDADLAVLAQQFPALANHLQNTRVDWADGPAEYHSETYPAWEEDNPNPGKHTIQLYDKTLSSDQVKQLLPAEMLHVLGAVNPQTGEPVDPAWLRLKQFALSSRTPEQMKSDMRDYQDTKDPRSFKDYMQQSRGDAYLRAMLFPEINPEWADYLTPDQRGPVAAKLRAYLQGQHQ